MTTTFSPQEILKIAVKVEENGMNLYAVLEKKTKNERLRPVWHYLKEQEELHRRVFQEMLNNVGDYLIYESTSGEYEAYLKAIASGYIFTQGLIEKKTKELFLSDIEAVDFGIYVEKESILVYSALGEYVQLDKQAVLNRVIEEEKKHLVQLTSLKKSLNKE